MFTLTLTPAGTSHILVFKTGLELRVGVDYKVDGCRILMIGPNIPQVGDFLTAVYSPASQTEIKEADRSFAPDELSATPSGDIADRQLREALDRESGSAITENLSQGRETSRALRMLDDRQHEDPLRSTSRQVNPGYDGLGDGPASSSKVRRAAEEPQLPSAQLRDGNESKALEMLIERIARDLKHAVYSTESINPPD